MSNTDTTFLINAKIGANFNNILNTATIAVNKIGLAFSQLSKQGSVQLGKLVKECLSVNTALNTSANPTGIENTCGMIKVLSDKATVLKNSFIVNTANGIKTVMDASKGDSIENLTTNFEDNDNAANNLAVNLQNKTVNAFSSLKKICEPLKQNITTISNNFDSFLKTSNKVGVNLKNVKTSFGSLKKSCQSFKTGCNNNK